MGHKEVTAVVGVVDLQARTIAALERQIELRKEIETLLREKIDALEAYAGKLEHLLKGAGVL